MPDREKVKKGVWQCWLPSTEEEYATQCHDCPYYEPGITLEECMTALRTDALALLKQEAVKPVRDEQTGRLWLCGNCGSYVGFEDNDPYDPNEYDKYCRECGKPVLWEGR